LKIEERSDNLGILHCLHAPAVAAIRGIFLLQLAIQSGWSWGFFIMKTSKGPFFMGMRFLFVGELDLGEGALHHLRQNTSIRGYP
jgi:hypothetical protein